MDNSERNLLGPIPKRFPDYLRILFATFSCLNTVPVSTNSFDVSPRSTFQLFPNCHLRFIFTDTELVPGRINYLISIALDVNISFSNINANSIDSLKVQLSGIGRIDVPQFTQCLVLVYMEDELTENGATYQYLTDVMRKQSVLMKSPPHHSLFFGNFLSYGKNEANLRLRFYRYYLHPLPVKGLLLTVTHDEKLTSFGTQLVCIICGDTIVDIDVNTIVPRQLLKHLQLRKHSQFVQRQVQIKEWPQVKSIVAQNCDFACTIYSFHHSMLPFN